MGSAIPSAMLLPFALLILSIAFIPLISHAWWDRLRHQAAVAFVLALPTAVFLIARDPALFLHTGLEYISFISLLGSLYVISGGILVSGDLRATPLVNTLFLAAGCLLANLVGTTGASMLLIRPLLHTNSERKHVRHVLIFFIFLVSNIGGCLTALGDPPLFLGYLRGVPFFWTFRLFPAWAAVVGAALLIFFLIDRGAVSRESRESLRLDRTNVTPFRVRGIRNFAFLGGVILSAFLPPSLAALRPVLMVAMGVASYLSTPRWIRLGNRFSFYSITEVSILFAGIFVTMAPALLTLEARGPQLGINRPWQFFWLTGGLSSFLDNAPTYLVFSSIAAGVTGTGLRADLPLLGLVQHPGGAELLRAISMGAVFMGANDVHRERSELHGQIFGGTAWTGDAQLLRLHEMVDHDPDPAVRDRQPGVRVTWGSGECVRRGRGVADSEGPSPARRRLVRMEWYYLKDDRQLGPVPQASIRAWLESGFLKPDDLVWRSGMESWAPVSEQPEFGGPGPAQPGFPLPGSFGAATAPPPAGYAAYAGFWLRAGAYLIDSLLLSILLMVFWFPKFQQVTDQKKMIELMEDPKLLAVTIILGCLYYGILESSPWQATLGKKAFRLKVTDLQGRRARPARTFFRQLGKVVSSLLFNAGYVMAGFTPRKQALHDMLAGCLVVRE